jgi:peptide/nickel transport system substrate-binding protein
VKFWRKSALIAPAVIVAMTAAACGGGSDTGGGGGGDNTKTGGRLVFGLNDSIPDNLYPNITAGNLVSTQYVETRTLLAPFRVYPDFTVKPDADFMVGEPTSETTGGKQVITYHINPKAVWSDGTAVTSKDFNYTWTSQKSSDPKAGGCAALLTTTGYDQIASVEGADSDKTVTVTMTKPFADWKNLFNPVYPQHILDKGSPTANCKAINTGWPTANGLPVTDGPFVLEKSGIDINKKIMTMTRNPKWWGTPAKLDAIIVQSIGNDPSVSVSAMRNNEVQLIYPQPQLDLVKQIKSLEPTVTSQTNFGLSFEHLDFNTLDAQLKIKEVRQAFAWGLNRPDIVAKTVGQFDSRAQVLNNRYFVNNQPQYQDNSGGQYGSQDVQKAQQLLESVGYTKGSDGIYQKGGKRLSFQIMTTQNNPLRSNTIDVITQQEKQVGIEVKKFLNADIFAGPEKPTSLIGGQYQIALFAWVAAPFISQNQSIYQSPKSAEAVGQNYTRQGDPRVDPLLDQINVTTTDDQIKQLGNQVDKYLWDDMLTIPLYQKPDFSAINSNYTGFVDNATQYGPLWSGESLAQKA